MKLHELKPTFDYLNLDPLFWHKVKPTPLKAPFLVSANPNAFALINLDFDEHTSEDFLHFMNGKILPAKESYAMCYAGHQFGHFVSRLGDGRAINLGKTDGYYLQLKGAGKTRYSRGGDGRAVLRSSIREYLMSEAMHHLGIPTSRALALIGSNHPVQRERRERGAIVLRLAPSWVRFGTFEYFYHNKRHQHLVELADFVIAESFPHLKGKPGAYLKMFLEVTEKTAHLMALWQSVGFNHGVMNTDNMSIAGLTIDYGPFAFLDDYDQNFICNHTDEYGRYSFGAQPYVAHWNLYKLSLALSPIVNFDAMKEVLDSFGKVYTRFYTAEMRKKLGLYEAKSTDEALILDLLNLMQESRTVDYTLFFRNLSQLPQKRDEITQMFLLADSIVAWLQRYEVRIKTEAADPKRSEKMLRTNPKYILKNYMLQEAIDRCEAGDAGGVEDLLTLAQKPFDEHPQFAHYAKATPHVHKNLKLSCSS